MEGSPSPRRRRHLSLTGRRYRHPSDVARLVFNGLLILLIVLVDLIAADALRSFGAEFLALVDGLPPAIVDGVVGLLQLTATLLPIAVLVMIIRRRSWTQLLILSGAAGFAVAGMFLLDSIVDQRVPASVMVARDVNSWFIDSEYPPAALLASITAVLVAASPQLARRWRRAGWWLVFALVVARALSATEVPVRNGLMVAIGAFAGSLALVVFGAPRRRIDPAAVNAALADVGVETVGDPEQLGEQPVFRVQRAGDEPAVARVFGRDQRDTDLLITSWRAATTKGLGDVAVARSPLRSAETEALQLALFRSAGARVATPVALAHGDDDETAVLVTTELHGRPLAEFDPASITDDQLSDLWRQVDQLQRRRLAHRRLGAANLYVEDSAVSFDELHWAEADASDPVLGADVAELLVVTSLQVGVDRAVDAAADELPSSALLRALPLVQSAALTRDTQRDLDARDDADDFDTDEHLSSIRSALTARLGVDPVEVAPVKRVTVQGVVSLVGSAVLVWYVLTLASDWDLIWDAFTRAELIYVIPITMLALSTYLTGAMSLRGASPVELEFGSTTAVMFGQSYLNRFTPANAGGMAMRMRYLQLQGASGPVAATAVGLTSAASGIAQGAMIVIFLLWGGASDRLSDFELPAVGPIVIGILVVGALIALVLASRWGRNTLRPWLSDAIGKVREMISDLASDPRKLAQLLGGATLGKIANIAAFWLSAVAFDVDISFPKAGALYIIATTIGSAVPTPGGVGGVDAALTAALIGFGVGNADAAAVVLMFRMLTFWLPTLPGYLALRWCQRTGLV